MTLRKVKIIECSNYVALETEVNAAIKKIEEEYIPGTIFIGGRVRDIKYAVIPDTPVYDGSYSAMIVFEEL